MPAIAAGLTGRRNDPAQSGVICVLEHLGASANAALKLRPHERVALELILHVEAATVSRQRSFEKLPVNRVVCGFLRHDV